MSKRTKRQSPSPVAKRRFGCVRWFFYGVIGMLALVGCGVIVNIVSPQTADQSERAVVLSLATSAPTLTATNTPAPVVAQVDTPATSTQAPTSTSAPTNTPLPTNTAPPIATPTSTATPAPTATSTSTSTPAPTATLTATPLPTATPTTPPTGPAANSNANLRAGPGTEYDIMGNVDSGATLDIVGQNAAGDWLQLASGLWIAASLANNTPPGLPVTAVAIQAPPSPVPTQYTGWQREDRGYTFRSECECNQGDILNCGDFGSGMDAQACYLKCMEETGRDVHGMDRDKDTSACEWKY